MNAGQSSRFALVSILACTSLVLAGCGPKEPDPSPSGSNPTPTTAGPLPADDSGMAIQGETEIGPLGDPCVLLRVAEVEAGTGFHVTAITRGVLTSDDSGPSQNCVYLTDGPALVGALATALGAMSGQDPSAVAGAIDAAGGLVGITLTATDPETSNSGSSDDESDTSNPEVNIRMVANLGLGAAVILPPSGAAGFAASESTTIMLMVLIDGAANGDGVEQMLRSAFGRL